MKLFLYSLLIAFVFCGMVRAQGGSLILARDSTGNDVSRSIGLIPGAAAADANSVAINAAIRNSSKQKYTLAFPAGDWYFGVDTVNANINGTCILLDATAGQSLTGKGLSTTVVDTDPNEQFVTSARLIYAGPKLDLSTTTHSLSGATITFTAGHTVISQDVGATVEITGGTGATTGFYVVESVGANTWTLDRAPGGSGTDLTGLMTYTLIRDPGFGTCYKGLALKGGPSSPGGTKCHVGLHIKTNTSGIQCGKAWLEQMVFSDFTAAVMTGYDMRLAYAGAGANYTGYDHNHADHLTILRPWWQNCRTGLYLRNNQSVCHNIIDPRFLGDTVASEVVYAERGGEMKVEGGDFSGSDVTALRLSGNGSNVGSFHYMDCRFDSTSNRPVWLAMDVDLTDHNQVTFQQCRLDEGIDPYTSPIWTAAGGTRLVLDQCHPVRTESIKLVIKSTGGTPAYWIPHCEVRSCSITDLSSGPAFDSPQSVIHPTSTANAGKPCSVTFSGVNTNRTGSIIYDNGRYMLGYDPDGEDPPVAAGWAAGYPLPTP
jgi:hypothetical protein